MREQYVEAVLAVADLIPPARVLSYGDIAALLDVGGPRQVGAVMSAHGGAVCWWRVVRSNGAAPACHGGTAMHHYRRERTPLRGGQGDGSPGGRLDMALARWRPGEGDFARIDALADRLRDADRQADRAPAPGQPGETGAPKMSVPRDGLKA